MLYNKADKFLHHKKPNIEYIKTGRNYLFKNHKSNFTIHTFEKAVGYLSSLN